MTRAPARASATRTLLMIVAALALVASACAEGDAGSDETTTTQAATTSSTEAVAETTTTASIAEATTTTAAEATTTSEALESDDDVEEFLSSLSESAEMVSGRIEGAIEMKGIEAEDAGITDATIVFASAFDSTTGDSSFLMDMSSLAGAIETDPNDPFSDLAAGMVGTMEVRQVGDRAYMQFPFFTLMLGAETEWISMPAEEGGDLSQDFQTVPSDPGEILDAYEDAEVTVENLGAETVNGVSATHYRITYDVGALIAELTPEERAELEESGVFADGVVPIDAWIDAEGYLVRMMMEIDGSTVDAPEGEGFESMSIRYDVFDINQPVTIEPPPQSEVTPIEDLGEGFNFDFGTEA